MINIGPICGQSACHFVTLIFYILDQNEYILVQNLTTLFLGPILKHTCDLLRTPRTLSDVHGEFFAMLGKLVCWILDLRPPTYLFCIQIYNTKNEIYAAKSVLWQFACFLCEEKLKILSIKETLQYIFILKF